MGIQRSRGRGEAKASNSFLVKASLHTRLTASLLAKSQDDGVENTNCTALDCTTQTLFKLQSFSEHKYNI